LHQLNVWETLVLFVKFGKTGKPRMSLETVYAEIVDTDKEFSEEEIEILHNYDHIYGTPFHAKRINLTKMERMPSLSKDLLKLDTIDFMHHLVALSIFVKKLNDVSVRKFVPPQHVRFDIDNFIREHVGVSEEIIISPELFGEFILRIVKKDAKAIDLFIKHFSDKQIRISQMESLYEELIKSRIFIRKYIEHQQNLHYSMLIHGKKLIQSIKRKEKSEGKNKKYSINVKRAPNDEYKKINAPPFRKKYLVDDL